MRDHTKLRAFELADEAAIMIYKITKEFPKDEIYGLTSQIRRAAVSVPSNIVEGCARESQTEYTRFLEIAFGSLKEAHYQLTLAERLDYLDKKTFLITEEHLIETEKVLGALSRSIRRKLKTETARPKT
jgi:four helix bundle protein